ncbi:hypothetical protein [Hymenobacter terrestris]|uniref:Uncharacterized protein n=1 Tax=Hymenobacter terrestris TaxID=2748310 RepID=A0ABX2Q5U4_9BACT|nr:hypothetical protein [Hymenobacter terrestris]NVO86347.1 hypothetical protein [Hymenobacter terrestris]
MKQRPPRPILEELSEAMHGEFTVDAETDRQHRLASARLSVQLGLFTAAGAVEAYGFTLDQIRDSSGNGLAEGKIDGATIGSGEEKFG